MGAGGMSGGEDGGEAEGNRGWDDNTVDHVLNTCAQNLHGTHYSRNFRGVGCWGGVCIFLEIVQAFRGCLSKTARRGRCRVCAKFESSRRFRGSNMNPQKSLVDADASPSIHASIHRSIVSPTALVLCILSTCPLGVVFSSVAFSSTYLSL
jgi:hypothetical protein